MASIQGETKFVRQREKYSLANKKEFEELDKNVPTFFIPTPLEYFLTPLLIKNFPHFFGTEE